MTIQLRRDTAANWASANPVLASGQPGYDTTNKILKIGDGVTAWASLTGIGAGAGTGSVSSVSVATANGFSGSVANPTTTPAITLSLQDATGAQSGKLTSTDWNTFNSKRDITSVVPILYGGTGAVDESHARANLGISMTSLYSGGVVTNNGTTFSVTAGLGYIVSQTLIQAEPTHVAVNFSSVSTVTPLYSTTVIYVNSSGTVSQFDATTVNLTAEFKKQNIILSALKVIGGNIVAISKLSSTPISTPSKLEDLMDSIGPFNIEGNIFSANGANLILNKSAGKTFQTKSNITTSLDVRDITTDVARVPLINAETFYGYRNGSGGFTLIPYTGITPDLWDDGSGTPATVSNNKFTLQRVYFFNTTGATVVYLGQTEYSSLSNANASVSLETRVIDSLTVGATFRATISIQKGTTSLQNATDVAFFESSKFNSIGAGSSSSIATLQGTYTNSTTPEIVTSSTLGALTVQRGSAADTDNVIEGKNGAGSTTFSVTGNGAVTVSGAIAGSNLSGTNTGDQTITLTGGVTGSGTGSFAATVVTNANLTGKITSIGNATSLGSFTSAELATALTNETGSGVAVFNNTPTLITPLLGTPTSGVMTNVTGTAAGLTAGNVTTNANLTGHVTSLGNATLLGSFTSAQLAAALTNETGTGSAVFGTSPNITTPTGIVKGDVGLGNVDNTSDANKPVSTATQTALDLKATEATSIINALIFG